MRQSEIGLLLTVKVASQCNVDGMEFDALFQVKLNADVAKFISVGQGIEMNCLP